MKIKTKVLIFIRAGEQQVMATAMQDREGHQRKLRAPARKIALSGDFIFVTIIAENEISWPTAGEVSRLWCHC